MAANARWQWILVLSIGAVAGYVLANDPAKEDNAASSAVRPGRTAPVEAEYCQAGTGSRVQMLAMAKKPAGSKRADASGVPANATPAKAPVLPSSAPGIIACSFSISAEVEIPAEGAEGMLNAYGGRFGGYELYLVKSKPVFTYNRDEVSRFRWEGQEAITPGKHTIVFDFTYDGPGMAKGGAGVLKVDGKAVDSKKIPATCDATFQWDEPSTSAAIRALPPTTTTINVRSP